jgi:non-ribosomal peptide synthetase component F
VFLEKVKLTVPGEVVYLEDVVGKERRSPDGLVTSQPRRADQEIGAPTAWEKLTAFLMAFLLPAASLERRLRSGAGVSPATRPVGVSPAENASPNRPAPSPAGGTPAGTLADGTSAPLSNLDALATVIFSSGSTGEPKGVMLSHYNIVSNIEQMDQVFGLTKQDRILGILPFFHSFGFTGALALPAMLGVGVVFHPNPLDPRTIGPLVRDYALTFLLATPTFLQLYMRGCTPEQFGSLRVVMTFSSRS